MNCFFNSPNTKNLFNDLISNQKIDFSRYNYFYASYLKSQGKIKEAKEILNSALKLYPRNLLLNQYKIDLMKIKIFQFLIAKTQTMLLLKFYI